MASGSIPFSISLEQALAGAGAPSAAIYAAALKETGNALVSLRQAREQGTLHLFSVVEREDDLARAAEAAHAFRKNTTDIFVLGTGGASLGAQAIAGLVPFGRKETPRVIFFDNLDPKTFADALGACNLKTTRFLAISKSGATAETLMQTLTAADAVSSAGIGQLKNHFLVITEPKSNPLRKFAESVECTVLDHPPKIGGRFSVLSIVGLLPALLLNLDAKAVRAGAHTVLSAALDGAQAETSGPAAGAALHFALARAGRLRETVLWCYSDRLRIFGAWWRQLWAESLGKGGQGATPVAAVGPFDQHSQFQLFLDGPGGALFTLITTDTAGEGPIAPRADAEALGVPYLGGRHVGDVVDAEARATAETLAKRGRPVRRIHVPQINEFALGALFMHFMLETIIMGRLRGVDPFDQPAVEQGKALARAYLEGKP